MASLRGRLLVGAAVGVSLAFVTSGIAVFVLARSLLHDQFDETLTSKARALSLLVEQEPNGLEIEIDPDEVTSDTEVYELWIGDQILSRSARLGGHHLPRMQPGISTVALPFPGRWRQITFPFYPRDEPNEPTLSTTQVTLVLARSINEVDGAIAGVAKVLVGVGAVGTLVCLLIVAGVVRFGLSPLRRLTRDIARLRADDVAARLDAHRSPDELRLLVARLNDLLGRLGATLARERELTAEVAHELRTPLAGLRTTIEVSLARERSNERYRDALAACLGIATQTERTVETMLSLARLDAGAVAPELTPTAIDELLRDVLADYSSRIADRRLAITADIQTTIRPTDRAKLRVIVDNLVGNAVAYAEEGGAIDVLLTADRLQITNSCTTLSSADETRVFERFWRGDAARSIDSHAGLGLALARKLSEVIDASLAVTIANDTFRATLAW